MQVPVAYGKDPVGFLATQRKQLGDVFCVDLFLVKIVFLLGSEGNKVVFRAHEDDLSFWENIKTFIGPRVTAGSSRPLVKSHRRLFYHRVGVPRMVA